MIVAYDIAEPKRLAKVAIVMKDYGCRVQKSIFEVTAKGGVLEEMKRRIGRIINTDEDGVKYYPVCEKCSGRLEIIGEGACIDSDQEYCIL